MIMFNGGNLQNDWNFFLNSPIDLYTTCTNQGPYFLKLYIVYFITASSSLTPKKFNNLYNQIFIMI